MMRDIMYHAFDILGGSALASFGLWAIYHAAYQPIGWMITGTAFGLCIAGTGLFAVREGICGLIRLRHRSRER